MEIFDRYQSASSINQQIAIKKSELSALDKKDEEKSLFEKNDTVNITGETVDENDYQRVLDKYKNTDSEIRAHEQLHASLGNTKGAISYTYQTGPDGKLYATGGHVRLDTSIPSDPEAALAKLDKIADAAGAPAGLSGADAAISRAANLNKMLILNKQAEQEGENHAS